MRELRRMRLVLGTYVEVGACAPQATAERALVAAFESLQRSHDRWSFHAADSELSRLNRSAGEPVPLSRDTLRLLRLARALSEASGGRFNCTVGGTLVQYGHLPDHGGPQPLPSGRPDDVDIGRGHARLCRPVRVTLDGIAKGYAIDLAVQAMRLAGARSGWINAGGDLRAFGDKLLQVHRREADGAHTPLGGLREAALASSRVGGDPDGAFPACIVGADGAAAEVVSVIARSAWRADALTKVAALAPRAERAAAVARLGGHWVEPPALRMAA